MYKINCTQCERAARSVCRQCINRHPIIKQIYEIKQQIELGGCSTHLTVAQTLMSELESMIDSLLNGEPIIESKEKVKESLESRVTTLEDWTVKTRAVIDSIIYRIQKEGK